MPLGIIKACGLNQCINGFDPMRHNIREVAGANAYLQEISEILTTSPNHTNRLQYLQHALSILENIGLTRAVRIKCAELVATFMDNPIAYRQMLQQNAVGTHEMNGLDQQKPGPFEALFVFNKHTQSPHILLYGIDLQLRELEENRTPVAESNLQRLIRMLLNIASPEQNEFNIDGVVLNRTTLNSRIDQIGRVGFSLQNHSKDNNNNNVQTNGGPSSLAQDLDQQMKDQPGYNHRQNVHTNLVNQAGELCYNKMRSTCNERDVRLLSFDGLCSALNQALPQTIADEARERQLNGMKAAWKPSNGNIKSGINLLSGDADSLSVLWGYIDSHPNQQLKHNLKVAMFDMFTEIVREDPCAVGRLQRIRNLPASIDPEMSVYQQNLAFKAEIEVIASEVLGEVAATIDADAKAMQNAGYLINDTVVADLKESLFRSRANAELRGLLGVPPALISEIIDRNAVAFRM